MNYATVWDVSRRPLIAVYAIRDTLTGEEYIGSALDLMSRWRAHVGQLRRGAHPNRLMQTAWDRDGGATIQCVVLEDASALVDGIGPYGCDPRDLRAMEQAWIARRQPAFNIQSAASKDGRLWRLPPRDGRFYATARPGPSSVPCSCGRNERRWVVVRWQPDEDASVLSWHCWTFASCCGDGDHFRTSDHVVARAAEEGGDWVDVDPTHPLERVISTPRRRIEALTRTYVYTEPLTTSDAEEERAP